MHDYLNKIKIQYKQYIDDKKYVFKSCGEWIVILERCKEIFLKKNFAKYRENIFYVADIKNKFDECDKFSSYICIKKY
jgi:hypothetical protein